MPPEQYRVGYEGGAWVTTTTETGAVPVHLEQGDPLPENVTADELARLANGGVLEGIDQAVSLGDQHGGPEVITEGTVDEIKIRVGEDPEWARKYLEAEVDREKPRKGLVEHLEAVIADQGQTVAEPGDG